MPDLRRIPVFPANSKERLKDPTPFAPPESITIAQIYNRRSLVPAGGRNNQAQGLSTGTNRMVASKIKRRNGAVAVSNLRMRFVNWYVTGGGVRVGNAATLTVTASVEYPAGTFHQAKLAGATSWTVSGLVDYVEIDPIGITIPANADYWVHTWADAGAGNNYPFATAQGRVAIDGYESGASLTDKTMTGGESGGASGTYGPAIVYGETLGFVPVVLIVGNSIGCGNNDRTSTTGDAFGNSGYIERLVGPAGIGLINFCIPSTKVLDFATNGYGSWRSQMALLSGLHISTIVNEWGINDVTADRTAAQIAASQASMNAMLSGICNRIIMSTLTPKTGTGPWSSAETQIIANATREAERVSYNALVRSGQISGQSGYLDAARGAETSLDSGIWNFVGGPWTDDGTHPIALGAASIAARLSVADIM